MRTICQTSMQIYIYFFIMKEKSRKQYTIIPKSFKINKKKLRSFMPRNKQKKAPQLHAPEQTKKGSAA